ncbi:MAG: 30S ribosomal protein S17 [Nanoarchaeota archaeon]|nr:30S ribosomal protein S17 [Nanoarchaeota archaeon]
MARTRKAGFDIELPKESCNDKNCPFHGTLKVRGKQFTGKVVSDRMQHSVIVEWLGWRYIPKYERYKKTRTRIIAHSPPCINPVEGDIVKIGECRPLSKTKNFVVLKVLGKVEKYELEKEALAEGKRKEKPKETSKDEVEK